MPATPISTDLSTIFADAPAATIKTATSLAGPWTERPNLYLDRLRDTVAPAIGQATFTYNYGILLQPDGMTFATVTPLNIEGLYVWVSIENTWDDSPSPEPIEWYGILEIDSRTPYGAVDGVSTGIQHFTAYDLKRIAEKYQIVNAIVENSAGDNIIEIGEGLTFNTDKRGEFTSHGNRSTNQYAGEGDEPNSYVFSYKEREQGQWSAEDAVNYLLTQIAPKMLPDVNWYLEVASGNLDWNPKGNVQTDRKTFKGLLDELISRHRGVGYYFAFTPDDVKPSITVTVFSYSDIDITMPDGSTFDANPNQYSLDFEEAFDIASCNLTNIRTSTFHRVVAEGAWRTSTCTMQVTRTTDGNQLIRDWSSADQQAYADGASGEAWYASANREQQNRANDESRGSDKLTAVYKRFKVSDEWDLVNIDPLSSSTPNRLVFPAINPDDQFAFLDPDTLDVADSDKVWISGLTILDKLTLRERYDYSEDNISGGASVWKATATVDVEPPFLDPFTIMKTGVLTTNPDPLAAAAPIDAWELLDKIDGAVAEKPGKRRWRVNTKAHRDRAAVLLDVQGGPQHMLAKNSFIDSVPAVYDASHDPRKNHGLDWYNAWVTLTFESTERAKYEVVIDTPATGEQERVLRIQAPDCRLDYVVPNTVVGVVNGALKQTNGGFVRDDRERLANFAEAAALWYGRTRQTLDLSFKQVRRIVTLGDLITDVGSSYQKTDVNSVVTAITYDLQAVTTQWETSFAEFDVA